MIFSTHDSIKDLLPFVSGKEKYDMYASVKDCPVNMTSEFSRWKYWDEFSLSAYYEKEYEDAIYAYSTLIELNLFPESQRERILSNAKWFDQVNPKKSSNVSLEHLQKTLQSLQTEIQVSTDKVTKCAHFIYLKGYDFGLHHFLAILSAERKMGHSFDTIFLYYDIAPDSPNIWWSECSKLSKVKMIQILPPTMLNGHPVPYKQHQADIIRLEVLYYLGGVYFDLDMITYKDFTELIDNTKDITMVNESNGRVSNAFIIVKPKSTFVCKWREQYRTKYGSSELDWWAGLSVEMPHTLSIGYTGCTLLPTKTTLPFDYFYTDFFTLPYKKCTLDLTSTKCIHLWDTEQQKRGILPETIEELKITDSMMWELFKDILEEYRVDTTMSYLLTEVKKLRKKEDK